MQSHRMWLAMPPSNYIWILAVVRSNVCWCGEMSDEALQIRQSTHSLQSAMQSEMTLFCWHITKPSLSTPSPHTNTQQFFVYLSADFTALTWKRAWTKPLEDLVRPVWICLHNEKNPLIISGVIISLRMSWQQLAEEVQIGIILKENNVRPIGLYALYCGFPHLRPEWTTVVF